MLNDLEGGVKGMLKINPMERMRLIEEIGSELQESMTTSDINVFFRWIRAGLYS